MGDQNATAAPSGTFDAADGPLNIAANRQEQFETLCRLRRPRPDLMTDPRFADREARKLHRDELNDELNARAAQAHRRRVGTELLPAAGVPAARILTVPQAVESEQLAHRGFFTDVPFPGDARPARCGSSGNGVLVNGEPLRPTGAATRARASTTRSTRVRRTVGPHARRSRGRRGRASRMSANVRVRRLVGHQHHAGWSPASSSCAACRCRT